MARAFRVPAEGPLLKGSEEKYNASLELMLGYLQCWLRGVLGSKKLGANLHVNPTAMQPHDLCAKAQCKAAGLTTTFAIRTAQLH